jgi:hypothetical protein
VLDLRHGGRHAGARDAHHELDTQRGVEQALVPQLQCEPDVAGVEALELGGHAVRPEGGRHAPQEGQIPLEDALAEVDRPAVERPHLGPEGQTGVALVAHGPSARGAAGQVQDRVAALRLDGGDQAGEGGRVLRRRAVGLPGVQMQHGRACPPGRHGGSCHGLRA